MYCVVIAFKNQHGKIYKIDNTITMNTYLIYILYIISVWNGKGIRICSEYTRCLLHILIPLQDDQYKIDDQ